MNPLFLGVNIDHIATLRQARLTDYPDLIQAVKLVEQAGADSITLHLREDRRHIQDADVYALKNSITTKMNLEMAATDEMVNIACQVKPEDCCIVPESREELTTEGGLNIVAAQSRMQNVCAKLAQNNIKVSLFIDPDITQIDAAKAVGTPIIELHTGHYADAKTTLERKQILTNITQAATYAHSLGLQVNAGHGLCLDNTKDIAKLPELVELNIGHSIITRAIFIGLEQAVKEIKIIMMEARQ